ncbi:cysteine protease [Bordetella sp. J329]|nr:cysteine protease [Bordetella sp. J329]
MHRLPFKPSLLAASILCAATPVFAALQPIAEAPLAGDIEFSCQFNADNSTDCLSTYSFTILKPSGREMLSRIDRSYAETDSLTVEKAEVTQPGEQPVPLDESQIDTRTAPNPDQGFLREHQTSLAFPNLRVGTRISYTLREHFAAQPLGTQFHYVFNRQPMPVRDDSFVATFTSERPIVMGQEMLDAYRVEQSADKKTVKLSLKEPPLYLNYINEADNAYLRHAPRLELGSSLDLQENLGPFAARYNEILNADLPKGAAAAVAAVQGKPVPEQVAGLMQYINDTYRYLGDWRASGRGYVPFTLEEIERNGYGDCKDLAVLLGAMLKAAGIKAEPTLVSRGDMARELLIPGMYAPNHAIIRAEVDGQVWWLDPTNPVFAPGRIMPDIQQRWALVLGADGQVRREDIPLEAPSDTLKVIRHEHYTQDGEASVESRVEMSNALLMDVSVTDRLYGRTSTDQELCRRFAKEGSDCVLEREESTFVVPASYAVAARLTDRRALERRGGQYTYSREDLAGQWEAFAKYRSEGQMADLYQGEPQIVTYDVTLSGGKIDEPAQQCKIGSPWFDIELQAEPTPDGYRYRYREAQKVSWLSHDEINSAEFGKLIDDSRRCIEKLHLAVTLPKS